MSAPTRINITRVRGDTYPFTFTIKDSGGAAVNITGCSFVLTVASLENPPDATTNVLQLAGTLADAAGGVVRFHPSALDADKPPGTYYFDVQMTDSVADVRTVVKGRYLVLQDITK